MVGFILIAEKEPHQWMPEHISWDLDEIKEYAYYVLKSDYTISYQILKFNFDDKSFSTKNFEHKKLDYVAYCGHCEKDVPLVKIESVVIPQYFIYCEHCNYVIACLYDSCVLHQVLRYTNNENDHAGMIQNPIDGSWRWF